MVQSIKIPGFRKKKKNEPLKIKGLISDMAVQFGGCCHPLPGDKIVGIVTTGKGVTVHKNDCKILEKYAKEPERWLDIDWGEDAESEKHTARLKVMLSNEPGDLSNIIARQESNISNLNIVYRTLSYFEILVDLEVKDVQQLENIIAALKSAKVVSYVARTAQS
jgi:GTP pyrophosphokinase